MGIMIDLKINSLDDLKKLRSAPNLDDDQQKKLFQEGINYFQKGQKCIIPKIGQVIFQKVQV